jgi:hypothetical protein
MTITSVTFTEYSSPVFVARYASILRSSHRIKTPTHIPPSGTTRPVNKYQATDAAAPANKANPTPSALSACGDKPVSDACSSFVKPTTTTETLTSTCFTCTTTSTTIATSEIDRTSAGTYIFTVFPPPNIIPALASIIHTTTVPADCLRTHFNSGGYIGDGNLTVSSTSYPNFPQTDLECCTLCWGTESCIASAFISSGGDCQLLTQVNGTEAGANAMCPLGIRDYPFGVVDKKANVFPGPCGM